MDTLGLHVTPRVTRAVLLSAKGDVRHSAAGEHADPAAAVRAAIRDSGATRKSDRAAVAMARAEPAGRAAIAKALGRPLAEVQFVDEGAAAVAVEAWNGAARGARHAVCLWIGDTVFAGILLDGKPWTGARGLAGSAAWLTLNPVDRQDYRKYGGLAAEVSDRGIASRIAWRIQAGDRSDVLERAGQLEAITATHVYEAARRGDGVALSVVRDTGRYIGMAAANLANVIDPEVVVIAGPVAAYADLLLEPVRQECIRRLAPGLADTVRCEMSSLGAEAVAAGAARLAASPS